MTGALAIAGVCGAWLGITLLTVADGRRGLALGLAVVGAALALAAAGAGAEPPAAVALAVGGLGAAAARLRVGGPGWGLLAADATPRLVASVVVLILGSLVEGGELGTPAGLARLAALGVAVLATGRLLTAREPWLGLGAGAALALGLGALGGTPVALTGAAVAVGLGLLDGMRGEMPIPPSEKADGG